MNINKVIKWLVCAQLSAVLAAPSFAGPSAPDSTSISGTFSGTGTPSTDDSPAVWTISGTASHLGRFTAEMDLTVTPDLSGAFGTIELVAANGDTLFGDVEGVATFMPPATLLIEESITITGGTGRFEGVTGSLESVRLADISSPILASSSGAFTGELLK
jgi:hypothetical protein